MQYRIVTKLEKVGATSKEKAVTIEKAGLNPKEKQWLNYVAGGLDSRVKKTKDKRYYIQLEHARL